MPEIERIYPCILCEKAYDNLQALRGHLKKHRGEYLRTTIYVRRGQWKRFDEVCMKHKTTTCAVLDVLVKAMVEGESKGVINLKEITSPNPVVFNMSNVFLGKPRSKYKIDVSDVLALGKACHVCGSRLISERGPLIDGFMEGSCLRCEARWLIMPKKGGE